MSIVVVVVEEGKNLLWSLVWFKKVGCVCGVNVEFFFVFFCVMFLLSVIYVFGFLCKIVMRKKL